MSHSPQGLLFSLAETLQSLSPFIIPSWNIHIDESQPLKKQRQDLECPVLNTRAWGHCTFWLIGNCWTQEPSIEEKWIHLPFEVHIVKDSFPSSHVWMWSLDCKRKLSTKEWCFRTVTVGRPEESGFLQRRSNQSILGNQPEHSLERTDAKTETPLLWAPDMKGELSGKGCFRHPAWAGLLEQPHFRAVQKDRALRLLCQPGLLCGY